LARLSLPESSDAPLELVESSFVAMFSPKLPGDVVGIDLRGRITAPTCGPDQTKACKQKRVTAQPAATGTRHD
jgi:hypothetical protein